MQPVLKLVILGRDGILNEFREDHIKAPEEWVAVPGALEAVLPARIQANDKVEVKLSGHSARWMSMRTSPGS